MYFDAHNIAPRFEFGFGLSYKFTATYSGLKITTAGTNAYTITVSVKNSGTLAGTEISQLYLGYPASAGEPPKVLRGFQAVPLTAGQTLSVSFSLVAKDIRCVSQLQAFWLLLRMGTDVWNCWYSVWSSVSGSFVRPSGTFTVYVGSSSRNIALTGTF